MFNSSSSHHGPAERPAGLRELPLVPPSPSPNALPPSPRSRVLARPLPHALACPPPLPPRALGKPLAFPRVLARPTPPLLSPARTVEDTPSAMRVAVRWRDANVSRTRIGATERRPPLRRAPLRAGVEGNACGATGAGAGRETFHRQTAALIFCAARERLSCHVACSAYLPPSHHRRAAKSSPRARTRIERAVGVCLGGR